jgi:isopentenyl diphosphate isomerase/L-lactate dehydrogenase-like FMN-dependent dehydrogenase
VSAAQPVNIADLERLAAEALDAGPHGYFAGGAGDERTLRRNTEAFDRWELRPRVLVDVSEISTRCSVLGTESGLPVFVAPVAFQGLAHPDGEAAMARAAQSAGTVICLSTLSSTAPAKVAASAPDAKRWLQLYLFRDHGVTRALLEEAIGAGYEAILLTVDAPYAGRPADLRAPAIEAAVGHRSLTVPEVFGLIDPSVTWDDLERLAGDCELPVLVKGLITAEDGARAVGHGAAGVVVSNHGGRQLDNVTATIDALPEVVEAVEGRIPVMMDGGIRRGTDIAVALALGADAVLAGRAPLWGLAVEGQAGAERALSILAEELRLAMALLGCASIEALTPSHVRRRPR